MKTIWKKDEGDMGIGTMIVFIALVLVAAVAAGLLIDVAGLVQQQGQTTGVQAINDVSGGLKIIETYANTTGNNSPSTYTLYVQTLYIKIALNAGSPTIDMEDVMIEVTTKTDEASLSWDDMYASVQGADRSYTASEIRDPDSVWTNGNGDAHKLSQGSLILVQIPIVVDPDTDFFNLTTQTTFSIKIIPRNGASTYATFTMPDTIGSTYIELF